MKVYKWDVHLALQLPYDPIHIEMARSLPKRRYEKAHGHWVFPAVLEVMDHVKSLFNQAPWSDEAQAIYDQKAAEAAHRTIVAEGRFDASDQLVGVPMRLPPYEHQRHALVLGRDQAVFAYLMEQGTGKSKVLLDDAAHNYRAGLIDSLLILCPNSVKTNWVNIDGEDEITKHLAPDIPHIKAAWFASMRQNNLKAWNNIQGAIKYNEKALKILAVNIEGVASPRAFKEADQFVKQTRCMIAVDESTRIKKHTTKRAKAAKNLRQHCGRARIMSGTPLIKSPLDAYSQFDFLDPNIINIPTYTEFQSRYAVMGGEHGRQVFRYVNVDDLSKKIAGCSYRVTKDQCLDLPEKVYSKRIVELTPEQRKHYDDMRTELITWLDAQHHVAATTVLAQMARLQQITAGYLPLIDAETGEKYGEKRIACPKIDEAMDIIAECSNKVIVWCRYKFEVREMVDALSAAGIGHVKFDGDTSEADRITARTGFNQDDFIRVFVGQIRTGGIGLTLNAASTVIYLSNTFGTEDRVQSEDRCHRIGQTRSVQYIDLVAPKTIDERVIQVLRANKRLSDEIMRDGYKAWI
jgi:SNF2 family DNA or RNA helicase